MKLPQCRLNKKTIGLAIPIKVKRPYDYHYPGAHGKKVRFPSADAMLEKLSMEAWLKTAQAKRYHMAMYGVEMLHKSRFPVYANTLSKECQDQYHETGAAWRKQYRELLRDALDIPSN